MSAVDAPPGMSALSMDGDRDISAMLRLIAAETAALLSGKGAQVPPLASDTRFLGGELPMDSLDLATLIVILEERTGRDPFRDGFRTFTTLGELAELYTP